MTELSRTDYPQFPAVLDSTTVSSYKSCARQAFLQYFLHYKPLNPSVHLHAGGAFAKGLEVCRKAFFQQGLPLTDAVALGAGALLKFYGDFQCPEDSAKSLERMLGAYEFYHERYPMDQDKAVPYLTRQGTRAIEFSFAHPIDILHPVTGDPILYVGRMDQIVEYAGALYGEDDKTTSQLGASWPRQWDLRSQFTGYCWGAAKAEMPLAGFLVRGISILKTKYDTMEAITYRHPWMIDQWYEVTCRTIEKMIVDWRSGNWDPNLGDSCSSFGGCIFARQVCVSPDPQPWLDGNFARRVWDPVAREEVEA